ncbi:MAG: hypothetical protein ACLQJ0_09850 [Steroidobacteraceae bacterium]
MSVATASIELRVHSAVRANKRIFVERSTDAGLVLTTVIALFTARVVCEQTLLTWGRGGQ